MKARQFKILSFIIILALLLPAAAPVRALAPETPDAPSAMPAPLLTFEGLSRPDGSEDSLVPDTSGDAGKTRYIQAVNGAVAIYTKTGALIASSTLHDFWYMANTGSICDGYQEANIRRGQVNVLYDQMAQRWVIMHVAFADVDNGPYFFCIAVTNSSAGEAPDEFNANDWWFYQKEVNESWPYYFPDQPRIGLWPDGYYIAADLYDVYNNGLNRTPKGAKVWAINREDLVNHADPFRARSFYLNEEWGYSGLLPSNLRGDPPPTGTPNFYTAVAPPNMLYVWKFKVDWGHPELSTFPFTPIVMTMDSDFPWAAGYEATQPGTSEQLDVRGNRLMSSMYRVVDGVGALWTNHTVMSAAGKAYIRWYEVRNLNNSPSTTPYFYQQGTYQPDSNHRWLGSLAVDAEGNMALGFSISSAGIYPSIRYAGRLAGDPLHTMAQGEATLWSGTTYQDNQNGLADGQWGRFSAMTVDPVDDCVFWYTNEYYNAFDIYDGITPHLNWRTRIGWFRFPSCRQGTTARISLHTNNTQGTGASGVPFEVYSVSISADGRYAAFASEATDLVDGGTNGHRNIYVRDRDVDQDGIFDEPGQVKTLRISRGLGGALPDGDSNEVSISGDGRFVAFSSEASNLVEKDTNSAWDVFVYDRDVDGNRLFDEAGKAGTTRVSVSSAGVQGNARSDQPSISATYTSGVALVAVAFRSYANNLVVDDTINPGDIFVRDMASGSTLRVSRGLSSQQPDGESYTPAISANGQYVAFASRANNLAVGDANPQPDIFVFNRSTGATEIVSLNSLEAAGDGESYHPAISRDGSLVAFASRSTNFVDPPLVDNNNAADIFVRKRLVGETVRISVSFIGAQASADSFNPSISADGQFIAFASDAGNLDIVADTNGQRDIFLHDRETGLTRRISTAFDSSQSNGMSVAPAISGNGRHIAYPSRGTNLVTNDTNNMWDVFAHDRQGVVPIFLTIGANIPGYPGELVDVPVYFNGNGQGIDTSTFSVDFDHNCLAFNPADGNGDDIPDAITFFLPAGFKFWAVYNPGDNDGELDFAVYSNSSPSSIIPDGKLATIQFTVKIACQAAPGTSRSSRVGFSDDPKASFARNGMSLRGKTADGFVEILSGKPGDCNADGAVSAADISATVLEIFDGDGNAPIDTPKGTFSGNPVGCNSNRDMVVDAGDISCTILLIFGKPCAGGGSTAAPHNSLDLVTYGPQAVPPELSLPELVRTEPGSRITLPLHFTSNGLGINSLTFSLDFDPAVLSFDPADAGQDGVPDAILANLPPGFQLWASYDQQDTGGELDFAIMSLAAPFQTLPDGDILSISFDVSAATQVSQTVLAFSNTPRLSFGDPGGSSIPGKSGDAFIQVGKWKEIFLPVLLHKAAP